MVIKKIFILYGVISVCLYNMQNNAQEYQKGTISWLHQIVRQSPGDAFNNPEITNNVEHYISLLEQQIKLLEEKLKRSPNTVKELKKITALCSVPLMISSLITCLMFNYKERIHTSLTSGLGEFGNSILFGTFLISTCHFKLKQLESFGKQQTYVENLNSELNDCKQSLATLQLLQKHDFTNTIHE